MLRQRCCYLWWTVGLGILFVAGCASTGMAEKPPTGATAQEPAPKATPLLDRYQPGQADRVRLIRVETYDSWVEMPDKEPTQKRGRRTQTEIVLKRQVEAIEQDGSAIMKITFEKAELEMLTRLSEDKQTTYNFTSTAEGTKATQGAEPALAGAAYRIKIGPDTKVLEIMDLDTLREQLGLKQDAKGTVAHLISEENIKSYHEREFMLSHVAPASGAAILWPVADVMVKAQAINMTFQAGPVQTQGASKIVKVTGTGQPVHTLPEGWQEPAGPSDFGRTIVKQMSDMQKYENTTAAVFDITKGRVTSEQNRMDCTLILLGEKISQGQNKPQKNGGGEMFTVVTLEQKFELLD